MSGPRDGGERPAAQPPGPPGPGAYPAAALAALTSLAALGALFLFPYLREALEYPLTRGAAGYVAKAETVAQSGLELLGTIRVGASLLLAVLIRATGQNGFTLVAVTPALVVGVVGLAAAATVRAGLGIRSPWVPVVAVLTWAAFVRNGMLTFHFDNLVNSALVVAAFAAAVAAAGWGRGALAATVLLMAGGLAHWPFYLFSSAVLVLALALHVWAPVGAAWAEWPRRLGQALPLAAAVGASGAFVALTLLSVPPNGWRGARLRTIAGKLRARFLVNLRAGSTYLALPVAALGGLGAAVGPAPEARPQARRMFLCLMASWVGATAAAGVAQFLGRPTAGARLVYFLFPVTILTGVAVWSSARWLAARRPAALGGLLAGLVVVLAVGGFGALTARWWDGVRSRVDREEVQQAASAGAYLERVAPGRQAVFVLSSPGGRPAFQTIQAAIPADLHDRVFPYFGTLEDLRAGVPTGRRAPPLVVLSFYPDPASLGPHPVAIVLEEYNREAFRRLRAESPGQVVAPGVWVDGGPLPPRPLPPAPPPTANVRAGGLVLVSGLVVGLLFLAGSGWAAALLPPDPLLRVLLAPALGIAAVTLVALGWDRAGLPFTGASGAGPLAVAAVLGWGTAGASARRGRRGAGGGILSR